MKNVDNLLDVLRRYFSPAEYDYSVQTIFFLFYTVFILEILYNGSCPLNVKLFLGYDRGNSRTVDVI